MGSRVLLLDEAVEHLDPDAAIDLMDELVRHARTESVAVVVVTHHQPALTRADWVLDIG